VYGEFLLTAHELYKPWTWELHSLREHFHGFDVYTYLNLTVTHKPNTCGFFFSITSLCQGWQRVQKVASKANNEMHPYYKERVSKVLNTETEHAVVILLGREFQSEMEWGIKEYK